MNLIQQIKEAGIVGCGGAGFPTHVKLNAQVEYFIVNGAECEPLLRTDRWLMCNRARELVEAAWAVKEHLGAAHGVIGLKGSYRQEIAALEEAIAQTGAPITLHKMESFYPAGDEQVLVREVTGRWCLPPESHWTWGVWYPMPPPWSASGTPWRDTPLPGSISPSPGRCGSLPFFMYLWAPVFPTALPRREERRKTGILSSAVP